MARAMDFIILAKTIKLTFLRISSAQNEPSQPNLTFFANNGSASPKLYLKLPANFQTELYGHSFLLSNVVSQTCAIVRLNSSKPAPNRGRFADVRTSIT